MHSEEWYRNWKRPEILHGVPTQWNWIVLFPSVFDLGRFVDIGAFSFINARFGVKLGDRVQIGPHVTITSDDTISNNRGMVIVEEDASVGAAAVVFPGVTIGKHSTVGAGMIVTKDVPPDTVVYADQHLIYRLTKTLLGAHTQT